MDQSNKLPVISCGRSNVPYPSEGNTYSSTLLNQCGLVKFVTSETTTETVIVSGMHTTALIDFSTNSITPVNTTGTVKLYSQSGTEKWAIVLPNDEVENPAVGIVGYSSTINTVPAVTANMYYTQGVQIEMTPVLPYIDARFTAGTTKIKFSRGNLQYIGTGDYGTDTPRWRFADHQYDYMGRGRGTGILEDFHTNYGSAAKVGQETDYDKMMAHDLFGWASSGYANSRTNNQPSYPYSTWMASATDSYGGVYDAYSYGVYNRYDIGGTNVMYSDDRYYDWGVNNSASIENNCNLEWRTLSNNEWTQLFSRRFVINGNNCYFYGFATVMGVSGVILLPDNWDGSVDNSFVYGTNDYTANTYTDNSAVTWNAMEAAGCVFLPAARSMLGGYIYSSSNLSGEFGLYWSSSRYKAQQWVQEETGRSAAVCFYSGYMVQNYPVRRDMGCSVRLVTEVN